MYRPIALLGTPVLCVLLSACGGATAPPAAPAHKDPPAPAATATGASSGADAGPADKHTTAEAAPHEDPHEKEGVIDLAPLVEAKATFPKQTVGDHDCLKELPFSGRHKVDFATIIGRCGTPTGMLEYTKPAEGHLHAKHDKRDEFKVKVQKGMCYRYFAVADDGIKDIDIIILRKGALLAMDRSEQPVAIIEGDKLWCSDEDVELQFNIEIDGRGAGGYTFGIWTRPKK